MLAVMVVMCGGAGLFAASPASATGTSIDTPLPGTGCTLHTRVSATADPQSNPPIDPTGTNVGATC